MPQHFLVVGAGVFGASTAYELVRAGQRVTVLDRSHDGFAAPDAASNDLNKIIRSDYSEPHYSILAKEAIAEWRASPLLSPYYHEVGFLLHSGRDNADGESYVQSGLASAAAHPHAEPTPPSRALPALAHRISSAKQAAALFSQEANLGQAIQDLGTRSHGYYNPRGGWAEANAAVRAMLSEAQRLGANIVPRAQVAALLFSTDGNDGGKRVTGVRTTDGRTFDGDMVILAPGCWLSSLLRKLLPDDPVHSEGNGPSTATAQTVLTIQLSEQEQKTYARAPVVMNFATGFYVFEPNPDGVLKCAIHGPGYLTPAPPCDFSSNIAPPSFPTPSTSSSPSTASNSLARTDSTSSSSSEPGPSIPPNMQEYMLSQLSQVYPEIAKREVAATRVCWYADSSSEDENWVIDHHPRVKGLFVAGAGSGHGYKFLPILGRLVLSRLHHNHHQPSASSATHQIRPLTAHQAQVWSFAHHEGRRERELSGPDQEKTASRKEGENARARL